MENKLNIDRAMNVLLGDNDEERKTFIDQHKSTIKPLIRLVFCLSISGTKEEKSCSVQCLAKISEIECQSILDTLKEESLVYEKILFDVGYFITNFDNQPDDESEILPTKYYLIILNNITRQEIDEKIVYSLLQLDQKVKENDIILQKLEKIFTNLSVNGKNNYDELIIQLLLNISRSSPVQNAIQNDKDNLASLLKVLLQYFESSTNPKIRSCCLLIIVNFLISGSAQETMLNPKLELIVKILSPLAGPTSSELDDEDMAKLPLDLQYLPPENEREANNCVRDALVSCLLLCCNTRSGREALKAAGTYYILRELHKWETDRSIQKRIEDVVDILIKDEWEFDQFPDLISTQIPEHLLEKFDEMDQNLLND